MSEIVLIDLGEDREAPVVAPRPPSPRRRRAIGAAVALACVLAVAGPARSAVAPVEVRIPASTGDMLSVSGDRMYVVENATGQTTITTRRVTAYSLPDGDRLWQTNVPPTVEPPWPTRFDDTVLFQTYDVYGSELLVLDDATGSVLWRRRADVIGLVPAREGVPRPRILLSLRGLAGAPDYQPAEILAVDLRTGEPGWSYRPPRDASVIPVWRRDWPETAHLVTALSSGRVEVRHLATGRLSAQAQLRPPAIAPPDEEQPSWLTTDEDLLLVSRSPTDGTVTAYGVERLDRRWTVRVETGGGEWYTGWDCGDLLCFGIGETGMSAVDRATGQVRWQTSWHWAERSGDLLIVGTHGGPYNAHPLALLDPATGEVRYQLGRWELAGRLTDRAGWLVVRHELTTNRAWFGLLEPGIPDVQFLGSVSGVTPECHSGWDALVCRRLDGSIGIWRYR